MELRSCVVGFFSEGCGHLTVVLAIKLDSCGRQCAEIEILQSLLPAPEPNTEA